MEVDCIKLTPCILFAGFKDKDGYGLRRYQGAKRLAHRVAYCLAMDAPIASIAGKVVLHTCDTPSCVNWQHLVLGTHTSNNADMRAKGRAAIGTKHGMAVLNAAQIEEVRQLYKPRCPVNGGRALAARFGVTPSAVSKIICGVTHVA